MDFQKIVDTLISLLELTVSYILINFSRQSKYNLVNFSHWLIFIMYKEYILLVQV